MEQRLTETKTAGLPAAVWVGLAVVLTAEFMDLVDATIVTVALPSMAADLGMTPTQVQWTLAGYTLAMGAGLITGGRVGDLYGRRRVFLAGLAAGTLFAALAALAPNPGWLMVMRILTGVAAAFTVPLVIGMIRANFPDRYRPAALGVYGATLGLAAVVGPILGGALVDGDLWGLGWRAVFWVNVPIGLVALLVGWRTLAESRDPGSARLDVPGAVLATAATVLVLLPLVQGPELDWPAWTVACLVAAPLVVAALVWRQRRVRARGGDPLIEPTLFTRRGFSAGVLVAVLFFGAIGSYFLLLVLYLQNGTGRTAWETGLVLLPYAIGSFITSALSVQLAARAGRALLVTGAASLAAAQVLLLVLLNDTADLGYWALAWPLFLGGLGLGLAAPPLIDIIISAVDEHRAGSAAGVLTTFSQIGNALGVAVLGTVFFATLDDAAGADVVTAHADALSAALPWQIGAYVLAALLMFALPRRARMHE